jgi:hypothetical protein
MDWEIVFVPNSILLATIVIPARKERPVGDKGRVKLAGVLVVVWDAWKAAISLRLHEINCQTKTYRKAQDLW